jgi:nucleotide-binding universal stress UspA family protein
VAARRPEPAAADRPAYCFLLALFPSLLFLTALLGTLPLPGLMDRLLRYGDELLPSDAASLLGRTLAEVERGGVRSSPWSSRSCSAFRLACELARTLAARRHRAGLLVLGTHGRSGVRRLGSVAERVVRSARCPVLTAGA